MSHRDIQELTKEIRELRIEAQDINRRLTSAEESLEVLNHPTSNNKETRFGFTVGERVKIATLSRHRNKIGTVLSFSPKKVRIEFQDGTKQAFFATSLQKRQNGADEQHK